MKEGNEKVDKEAEKETESLCCFMFKTLQQKN